MSGGARPERATPTDVLAAMGYREETGVYVHEPNPLTLDFPPGPLAVGGEFVSSFDTLREGGEILHILSPTDACRDRLAGFLPWNDPRSLTKALAAARAERDRIDLDRIREWCEHEWAAADCEEFARALPWAFRPSRTASPRS